jgi:predicted extracellular nuclease
VAIRDKADQTNSSGWFNGNDAVVLRMGGASGTIVDVIGQIGFNPGSEWGTGLTRTADNTLRRQASVLIGDSDFNDAFDPASAWDGFATDTFDGLGFHTVTGADTAPTVTGTTPADNANNVAVNANIGITFSEAVNVTVPWFAITCNTSGDHPASVTTADNINFTLDPSTDFAIGETCTVTVTATLVADQDANDPPDSMTADYVFDFTTVASGGACGEQATKIHTVQGNGDGNSRVGSVVAIEGVVVGDYQGSGATSLSGFFIQEEDGDADTDLATSEGIFVFDGSTPLAAVTTGDRVRVTGTVSEFFGMTELEDIQAVSICANGQFASVTPTVLASPVPNVPTGDLVAATAAINAYYEAFEGMLVTFPEPLSVAEYFELERYGQLVLSQGGRIAQFTAVNAPSAAGYIQHQIETARRTIILDDTNNTQNSALVNMTPLFHPTPGLSITNRVRGGDTITSLTGVLHWSWAGFGGTDTWRIRPVTEQFNYAFKPVNPRPEAPAVAGSLRVASFNLLNYFTTIDTTPSNSSGTCGPNGTQDCRGADSMDELSRQTDKTKMALCGLNADIVGLIELENNASDSLNALVMAVNGAGCGPYAFINTGTIGSDAIKVGLIYRIATVVPVGNFSILDSSDDPLFIDTKNRPALAQTFRQIATNQELTVVVNHFKSKGSDCNDVGDPDLNDGQGNCNQTRTKTAQALAKWLAGNPTGSSDPDRLIIGDLNSYAKEDPIRALQAGGYTNLVAQFGGTGAYSYVFDGQIGYLDYALANNSLLPQVAGVVEWHINADEPPSFDYNDTFRDMGEASFEAKPSALPLYEANEFRTADHDPVLIGLNLVGPTVLGDLNGDGLVNITDRDIIRSALNSCTGNARFIAAADYNRNGCITYTDYSIWYGYYRNSQP